MLCGEAGYQRKGELSSGNLYDTGVTVGKMKKPETWTWPNFRFLVQYYFLVANHDATVFASSSLMFTGGIPPLPF